MKVAFKLTSNIEKTYDEIFNSLEGKSKFFCRTEKEFDVKGGYVIILNGIDSETVDKILNIKGVRKYDLERSDYYCGHPDKNGRQPLMRHRRPIEES